MASETFDLLVVGGGITGAGIARDAQLRGLKVALVDQSDYAFGTSSRSSKLIHGGLRYLENFEFGLVFESLRERHLQRKLNPNLVWPVPFVFPVYKGDRPGLRKVSLGLWIYDILALFRSFRLHRTLSRSKLERMVPQLKSEGLAGGVYYYDCRTDDARLTLANVLSAEREGAVVSNYVRFERPVLGKEDVVTGATLRDQLSGGEFEVRCRHIAFAAGPWTDSLLGRSDGETILRPTKGVHVVIPEERLPVELIVVMKSPRDQRVVFAVPWDRKVYIGTTDTDFKGDPGHVVATHADAEYLLETTNAFFPKANLSLEDIRGAWAGLRPLIRSDETSPYKTSREHEISEDERGITTIAGGKLTTYRAMAEEFVDIVAQILKERFEVSSGRCRTRKVALDPTLERGYVEGRDPLADLLWRCHGGAAAWIRHRIAEFPAEGELLMESAPHVMAQVSWAVLGEHAERLDDVLIRRFGLAYEKESARPKLAERVATHMADLMGKEHEWVKAEVQGFLDNSWR